MAINAQELQGQWNQVKGKVKEKWNQLSDEDLHVSGANFDQIIGKIQSKVGVGRDEIEKFFSSLTSNSAGVISGVAEKARDFASTAGDRLQDKYGVASDYARERLEQGEDYVRANPGPSIAAALGLGLVVGLVVGISLRSR